MKREWGVLVLLVTWAFFASCASCNGPLAGPNRCKSVELERSKGQPYEAIRVKIDPEERFDELEWVKIETAEGYRWPVDTFRDESGTPYIRVPLHPGGIDGGRVDMEFATTPKKTCPVVDFEIEPIPEAPGTTAEVVDKFERAFELQADVMDLPTTDLASAVALEDGDLGIDLPPRGYLLGVSYWVLAHPDNPNSLSEFVATADDEALRISDAVHAHLGTLEAIDEDIARSEGLLDLEWVEAEAQPGGLTFSTKKAKIPDVATLAELYDIGFGACGVRELNDQIGEALGFGNMAAGLASSSVKAGAASATASGTIAEGTAAAAATGAGVAAAAIGSFVASWAIVASYETMRCAVYPSELNPKLEVELAAGEIEEDRENPLSVDEITGGAKSGDPTSLPARVIDIILNSIAFAKGAVGAAKAKGSYDEFDEGVEDAVYDWANEELQGQAQGIFSKVLDAAKEGEIGGYTWSGIDFNDTGYVGLVTETQILLPDPCGRTHCVRTTDVGSDTVNVFTYTGPFPGHQAKGSTSANVNAIEVDLGPQYQFVTPGEDFDLDWEIRNAVDKELEWEASYPLIREATTNAKSGKKSWTLPEMKDAYPIYIRADSTSTYGLRGEPGAPPRFGTTILDVGDILVFPSGRCIQPGKKLQFQAIVRNRDGVEIEWEPSALVNDDGLFTAPPAEVEFEIEATAKWPDGEEQSDTATVRVSRDCACWYSVSVWGAINTSHSQKFGLNSTKAEGELDGYTHGTAITFMDYPDDDGGELRGYGSLSLFHVGNDLQTGIHPAWFSIEGMFGIGTTAVVRDEKGYVEGTTAMHLVDEEGERFAFANIEYRFVDDASFIIPSTTCQNEFMFERNAPDASEPKDYWPFD
jgi:hypothetical protein